MNENDEPAGPPPDPQDSTVVRLWDRVFSEDLKPGAVIGHYRIIAVIGRGGMGVVFEAEQENPRRRVALKIINPGFASPEVLSRFGQETQILGRLQHPGIAQIFEAGTFDLGAGAQPFFAMEFIEGRPLTDYAHKQKLDTRQRLELMIRLCEAVQHAHQKGVIHRDLKPGNILVTHDGQPKILDFGVARATDADIQSTTLRTEIGALIGTIPYMSPEQAAGDPKELDTQSDVYALGVICYELLAGRLPYDLQQRMIHEAVRVIREDDPTPLSSVDRAFRGDIETIVAKALEKEKARRYQSASDLASDIRKYLNDEPIAARPPSTWYQLRKFARRNRVLVGGIAAVFVALVLGLAGTISQAIRANDRADAAITAEGAAQFEAYIANLIAADASLTANEPGRVRARLDACPKELRGWEWKWLNARSDCSLAVLRGHEGTVVSAAFSPDNSRIVTASNDGTARVWDAATGTEVAVLRGHEKSVNAAVFSLDGARVATASDDNTARAWDAAAGTEVTIFRGHEEKVRSVVFSPDGTRIVTASDDNTARVWDAATGWELTVLRGHVAGVSSAVFSPDGTRIVTTSYGATARVWDGATGNEVASLRGHKSGIKSAAFSPDGTRIVTASGDRTAREWDAATGKELAVLRGHELAIESASFSPDGTRVVTASWDKTARVWDAATGKELAVLRGHELELESASFSPDGTRVVTASWDKTARVWDAATGTEVLRLRGHEAQVRSASFSLDGTRLVTTSEDKTARVWDAVSNGETEAKLKPDPMTSSAAFSADSERVVTASFPPLCQEWDASTGSQLFASRGGINWESWAGKIYYIGLRITQPSVDGARMVAAMPDNTARVCDVKNKREIASLRGHVANINSVAFSNNNRFVVTASLDRTGRLWDAASGEALAVLRGHEEMVSYAAFSTDDSRIVTTSGDKTARVWDTATGKEEALLRGHDGPVTHAAFSRDGTRIVTASEDKTSRLWDTATGNEVAILRGHDEMVTSAAFSPDGTRNVTASIDKTVRVWDAVTGKELAVLRGHDDGGVVSAEFSPDGTRIVSASFATARVWDCVPYRDRYAQRLQAGPGGAEATTLLDGLFARLVNWAKVCETIRTDDALDSHVRGIALDLITVRAEDERLASLARRPNP